MANDGARNGPIGDAFPSAALAGLEAELERAKATIVRVTPLLGRDSALIAQSSQKQRRELDDTMAKAGRRLNATKTRLDRHDTDRLRRQTTFGMGMARLRLRLARRWMLWIWLRFRVPIIVGLVALAVAVPVVVYRDEIASTWRDLGRYFEGTPPPAAPERQP